jgi:hypothetical protein
LNDEKFNNNLIMNMFPNVDPISLPAPVELFKILHNLTLALHFIAVQVMLGGLLIATVLGFLARGSKEDSKFVFRKEAAKMLALRLPVVMTYVINLGVPPLLFLQVLYGRAFYTSSVLIGVFWIAVIFLLMGGYWHIYRYAGDFEREKISWWKGLVAWILVISIAKIYSTVMTLMLKPEVWNQVYSASPHGFCLPPHDSTLLPRWLFMITGGLVSGGLWMVWLASSRDVDERCSGYLSRLGGRIATVGVLINVPIAIWVVNAQPQSVFNGLSSNILYKTAGIFWLGSMLGILIFSIWRGFGKSATMPGRFVGLILIVVAMLSAVICRDGIRDITLIEKGFNVMHRTVVTNWYVVGIFLGSFVLGLIVVGWLINVMAKAKPQVKKTESGR